jgi:hypothetical protein
VTFHSGSGGGFLDRLLTVSRGSHIREKVAEIRLYPWSQQPAAEKCRLAPATSTRLARHGRALSAPRLLVAARLASLEARLARGLGKQRRPAPTAWLPRRQPLPCPLSSSLSESALIAHGRVMAPRLAAQRAATFGDPRQLPTTLSAQSFSAPIGHRAAPESNRPSVTSGRVDDCRA